MKSLDIGYILILALVIGFFVSGIFSDEFQTKADSIFFSTKLGRSKGVLSKIGAGGYIGTLFASVLAMLTSALTRSTPTAIIVPFIVLCAFPFLSRIITLPGLCSFFPDQLLEIYIDIKESGLVKLGDKVTTIPTVIVPVYAVICLMFQPILYKVYKK